MQGPFQVEPSGHEMFESTDNAFKSQGKKKQTESLTRNANGNMNRTIMPIASSRWQHMNSAMTNTMRYAPNSTGYSSMAGVSQSVDYAFDRMTDTQVVRDLRLHPAK